MARIINSPGVQITEKDLSLRNAITVGTNVVVPGFAPQGPVSEPILITTSSELEQVYGIPITAAEKYFHYTCREILNSPAILTTVRLPYGEESGASHRKNYSGLFYPMTLTASGGVSAWEIGEPNHKELSISQYQSLVAGDLEWTGTTSGEASNLDSDPEVSAGFFILNSLQTTINEMGEGYYVGFADNSALSAASPDFESVTFINTLSGESTFSEIPSNKDSSTNRLNFSLSATQEESMKGDDSVSEILEKVGFIGFETQEFADHLSLGVFKVRRSTADSQYLTLGQIEKHLGSLDSNRKKTNSSGGILENSFIEDRINEKSPTIRMYINPEISKEFAWTTNSTLPTARVKVKNEAKGLYAVGIYNPEARNSDINKVIGDVPLKLDKAFRLLESTQNTTVDVVVDAGLSTVYSYTNALGVDGYDNCESTYIDDVTILEEPWKVVTNQLINFSENTRRDCFTIIDVPRALLVTGKNQKVIDLEGKTFTEDIYNPLRKLITNNSNYASTYVNWVKISDLYSNRRMWAPFSGYAAAIFARNDEQAYTWSAPAGLNRGTFDVIDIAFNPNLKQRDRLYEISVNPVVFFLGDGYTVMGQKTLQTKPSAFDRINVRRLFLTLERATERTLKYFVFEPNTDFTRRRLIDVITPIFELAQKNDGLYDYMLVCDDRNNTANTIDQNELIVDIYLKPVRTAEFILVNFIATRTNQNFSELI